MWGYEEATGKNFIGWIDDRGFPVTASATVAPDATLGNPFTIGFVTSATAQMLVAATFVGVGSGAATGVVNKLGATLNTLYTYYKTSIPIDVSVNDTAAVSDSSTRATVTVRSSTDTAAVSDAVKRGYVINRNVQN